jgi:hypothetical protein
MSDQAFSTLLESLDEAGAEKHGLNWDNRLTARLESLAASYGDLRNAQRELIDYSDPITHAAYIYTYAQCRADFIYRTLKAAAVETGQPLFTKGKLRVCSLGGGPGSELVGLLRYLEEEENGESVTSIEYHLYDKEKSWRDTASALVDALETDIAVSLKFHKLDVTNSKKATACSLSGFDLTILSYFISEVAELPEKNEVIASLNSLLGSMDSGSRVLYCDNDASTFYYFFNYRRNAAGRYEQIVELKEQITVDPHDADIFSDVLDRTGRNQHLTGRVLGKHLVRN